MSDAGAVFVLGLQLGIFIGVWIAYFTRRWWHRG